MSHHWTACLVVATISLTMGCRGTRPLGQFVRVTEESDWEVPEVEAPRQRLATAKPRTDVDVTVSSNERTDPTGMQAAMQRTVAAKAKQSTSSDRGAVSAATASSRAPAEVDRKLAANSPAAAKSSSASAADPINHDELLAAFSDYPPEVQREALRRLVAATSKAAERTTQPASLDSALADNMKDLPQLPELKNTVPEVPPKRIAQQAGDETYAISLSDELDSDRERPTTELADLETSELETTVVQTISDSQLADKAKVKPASAERGPNDQPMVAQAALEPQLPTGSAAQGQGVEAGNLPEQALFAALIKKLSKPVAGESEADRAARLIRLRHLLVLSGQPDAAVERIEGMADAEQEFLRHQLLGLWTMVDPNGHPVPSRRFTTALPQIREATKFAAAATDSLEVRSLAFCTEIESYGQIKTFPANQFDAGQQVIMYCEIENFSVKKTDGGYETFLQGSYDIYNAANEKVVSQLLPADQQVSANYLRDYFIAYQMHLPQQLAPGKYRLQLTMEDVNGKKYGQSSTALEINK